MLTQRNWIYIETELAKRGGMEGAPDEHAEVSGKSGLELFCPPACSIQIFASYPKIMIIDTTEIPCQTDICETSDFRLFLEAKVQPLDLHDLGPSIPEKRSWICLTQFPPYFKTVMDFIGEQQMFM